MAEWRGRRMEASQCQPEYLALTNPLAGSLPPFVNGISKYPRPIVATGSRLFIGHAFTGEYTARFCPRSFDCQCVEPLQTAHHVIAVCPLHAEPRRQFLLPASSTLSRPSLERRNKALGNFLATSQAHMRPRLREPILEGGGNHNTQTLHNYSSTGSLHHQRTSLYCQRRPEE